LSNKVKQQVDLFIGDVVLLDHKKCIVVSDTVDGFIVLSDLDNLILTKVDEVTTPALLSLGSMQMNARLTYSDYIGNTGIIGKITRGRLAVPGYRIIEDIIDDVCDDPIFLLEKRHSYDGKPIVEHRWSFFRVPVRSITATRQEYIEFTDLVSDYWPEWG
jgi:hypothetical protein